MKYLPYLFVILVVALIINAYRGGMSSGNPSDMGNMPMGNGSQPFDLLFIDSMLIHHQGAIDMAKQAQKEATKPEIKKMAADIMAAQTAEMNQMQAWRQAWYPNVAVTQGMGMAMGVMGVAAGDKLYDLRFIEAMIPHHEGAINMAKEAQQKAEHDQIKTLADNIIQAQTDEVAQMKTWQQAWSK